MSDGVRMWTIYDHPRDYPNHFVLRGGTAMPDEYHHDTAATLHDTLEAARAALPPQADHCLGRQPEDDHTIVEVWI